MARINGTIQLDAGQVADSHFSNQAADVLTVAKMQHLRRPSTSFALAIAGTPVTREEIVFTAATAGVIRGFHALLNDTGSSASMTFDLKKNGTTVLSSAITIANTDTDKIPKDGTLSVTTFAAGDIFSIALTVSSSTGAQGPFAWAELQETAAAS